MKLLIFGMGYTSKVIAARLRAAGWEVVGTGREGTLRFDDREAVLGALAGASLALAAGWWSLRSVLTTPVVETLRRST